MGKSRTIIKGYPEREDRRAVVTLSVIVPVYNAKKYLAECLESIIAQTYSDMEIIVIDDGSTDGSAEICDRYARADSRVHVIHQENRGCIYVRSSGIRKSNGKYIGFVDSDDWIETDFYQVLMSTAEEKNCDIVSMGYTEVYESETRRADEGVFFGLYEKGRNLDQLLSGMMYEEAERRRGVHPSLCTKVIRKKLLTDAYDEVEENITMGEDAAVFYPCCLHAERIYIMKEYKYHYRVHDESMCRSMDVGTILKIDSFYRRMQKIFSVYGEKYDLQEQLRRYLWTFVSPWLQQTFGFQGGELYLFPYSGIEKGEDIILYGAGKVGKAYYAQISENRYCNIIAWADKAGDKKRRGVICPDRISDFEYDRIVIAAGDKKMAEEITAELRALGIKKEKIFWHWPQKMLFEFS